MNPGTYKIIRVDGTETVHEGKASIVEMLRIIGCNCLDTVVIDWKRQTVMFVDDTGMLERKPANSKATALYRAVCMPGTMRQIHGDVVIVGWQDGTDKTKSFEHGVGVGEDIWDAVFDACVQASEMERP